MIDWTKPMKQTFEYYEVDPYSWLDKRLLTKVRKATLTHSLNDDLKGSANYTIDEFLGECYIRAYLIAEQGSEYFKQPLGTFMVQTPSISFNGYTNSYTLDAYSPLIELQEKQPPIGYTLHRYGNIMKYVSDIASSNMRAPVIDTTASDTLNNAYTASTSDTYLSFLADLAKSARYTMTLSANGSLMFLPDIDTDAMAPKWVYTDDNTSILHPDISIDTDLYSIPNVVEVVYSYGNRTETVVVKNERADSPLSIQQRGREILYRDTDPTLYGNPSTAQLKNYATKLLAQKSNISCTVTYTHAFCNTNIGDCVSIQCKALSDVPIKAKIISQQISCEPGCPVTERASFTYKL